MNYLEVIVLALIQGVTEFLPISSSAHLILPSTILDWYDQGLAFDVAVHIGTLGAVILYFKKELVTLLQAWIGSIFKREENNKEAKLAWFIILSTIPAGLFGFIMEELIEGPLRSDWVIASSTIIFGALLLWVDKNAALKDDEYQIDWQKALAIGFAQAIAIIPGTSRSGITMTAALFLGFTREAATRFSFLMSIPIILLAGGFAVFKLILVNEPIDIGFLVTGIAVSFISAYICIHLFLKTIAKIGMMPFAIYRLILGFGIFAFLLM